MGDQGLEFVLGRYERIPRQIGEFLGHPLRKFGMSIQPDSPLWKLLVLLPQGYPMTQLLHERLPQ